MIAATVVLLLVATDGPAEAKAAPVQASAGDTAAVDASVGPQPAPAATPPPVGPEEQASVEYPLGPRGVPDFLAPGEPFTLTDLRYDLSDPEPGETAQSFAARVRFEDWGYLGVESQGDRRGLGVMTHRFAAAAFADRGTWDLSAEFRAPRFVLAAGAFWRGSQAKSWVLEPSLSFLLTPEWEVEAWTVADTAEPVGRRITELGGDLSWHPGARLSAFAELVRTYDPLVGDEENRRDVGRLLGLGQLGPVELTTAVAYEDVSGRFPRRNTNLSLGARVPLATRWLLEGGASGRIDHGSGELAHEYRASLGWHGRRVTLPRAGAAAERAVALARSAARRGEYELPAFDPDALRRQRERLSLSPEREAFRENMDAVYRAEVDERLVPLLGLEFRDRADELGGETVRSLRGFAGMPWPPAWPWRAAENAVPFLTLSYQHEWHTTATTVRSGADVLSLTIALDREMDLVVSWSHAEPTALDVVRGIPERRHFSVSYVYARGR